MRKLLIFLLTIALIMGAASALPLFGPPQGFRNAGAVEVGSLKIGGSSIDGADVSNIDDAAADIAANSTRIDDVIVDVAANATNVGNALAWLVLNDTRIDALVVPLATFDYSASSVDQGIYTASGAWTLTAVKMTPRVLGTSESAVTAMVKICDSGEAPSAGDNMLSGTLDLKTGVDVPQSGTVSAGTIANGKIVALDFIGDLTAAVGSITLYGTRA